MIKAAIAAVALMLASTTAYAGKIDMTFPCAEAMEITQGGGTTEDKMAVAKYITDILRMVEDGYTSVGKKGLLGHSTTQYARVILIVLKDCKKDLDYTVFSETIRDYEALRALFNSTRSGPWND